MRAPLKTALASWVPSLNIIIIISLESLQKFAADSIPGEFKKQPLVRDTVKDPNTQSPTASAYLQTGQFRDKIPTAV